MSADVHVWLLRLPVAAETVARMRALLTPAERERMDAYVRAESREEFGARRGALRTVLATYLGCDPRDVRLRKARYGKLELDHDTSLRFNLSDTRGLVAIAVSHGREVGVDVEAVRPRNYERLARATFAPDELAAFLALAPHERPDAFYARWTAKEAHAKAVGIGLRMPFSRVPVDVAPGGELSRLRPGRDGRAWSGRALALGTTHKGSLIAEGDGWATVDHDAGALIAA